MQVVSLWLCKSKNRRQRATEVHSCMPAGCCIDAGPEGIDVWAGAVELAKQLLNSQCCVRDCYLQLRG